MTTPTLSSKRMLLAFHLLLLVYPIIYFMQQNVSEFSAKTYVNTLNYVGKFGLLLIITYALSHLFHKKGLHIAYIILLSAGFCAVLTVTLCHFAPFVAIPCGLAVIGLSYILYFKNIIKPFALILGLMCLFSTGMYLYPLIFIHENKDAKHYPEMSYKPNIYFLVLESYHGNEALQRLFGFDNSLFLKYLVQNGFTVYQDIYATRPKTRTSLLTMLTLTNPSDIEKREHLLDPCLTGKEPCYVLEMLKSNGYQIKTKFPNNYLIKSHFDVPNPNRQFLCNTLFSNYYKKYFKTCMTTQKIKYNTVDDFNLDIINTINNLKTDDIPYMFITKIGGITEDDNTYKGGLTHLPNTYRHSNRIDALPQIKGNYLRELKKENIALTYIISAILKKDPDALIILFGDHGANHFEILKDSRMLQAYNMPLRDYILDLFNVIAAVRYPYGIKSVTRFQYLPELFPIIFDALDAPLDNVNILPVVYDYKNNPYYRN